MNEYNKRSSSSDGVCACGFMHITTLLSARSTDLGVLGDLVLESLHMRGQSQQ